jgi:uncharacterized membrane protein YjfL (UPF0719 family)
MRLLLRSLSDFALDLAAALIGLMRPLPSLIVGRERSLPLLVDAVMRFRLLVIGYALVRRLCDRLPPSICTSNARAACA